MFWKVVTLRSNSYQKSYPTYVESLFCTFVLYSTQRTNFFKLMIQSYLVLSRLINLVSTKEDFLLQDNKPPPCIKVHIFWEGHKILQICKTSTLLLAYVVPVKSKVEISQNFAAVSEYMNFTKVLLSKPALLPEFALPPNCIVLVQFIYLMQYFRWKPCKYGI